MAPNEPDTEAQAMLADLVDEMKREQRERADSLYNRMHVRRAGSGRRPMSRRRFGSRLRQLETLGYRVLDAWDLHHLLRSGATEELRERYGSRSLRALTEQKRPEPGPTRVPEMGRRPTPPRRTRRIETEEEHAERRRRAEAFQDALERHNLAGEYHGVTDLILDAGHGAPMLTEPLHAASLSNLYEDIHNLYAAYLEELESPYAQERRARQDEIEAMSVKVRTLLPWARVGLNATMSGELNVSAEYVADAEAMSERIQRGDYDV